MPLSRRPLLRPTRTRLAAALLALALAAAPAAAQYADLTTWTPYGTVEVLGQSVALGTAASTGLGACYLPIRMETRGLRCSSVISPIFPTVGGVLSFDLRFNTDVLTPLSGLSGAVAIRRWYGASPGTVWWAHLVMQSQLAPSPSTGTVHVSTTLEPGEYQLSAQLLWPVDAPGAASLVVANVALPPGVPPIVTAPEPATLGLAATGLALLAAGTRARRRDGRG